MIKNLIYYLCVGISIPFHFIEYFATLTIGVVMNIGSLGYEDGIKMVKKELSILNKNLMEFKINKGDSDE